MKTTLSVSIDEDLSTELRAEADSQRRPLSWIVAEALRLGLHTIHAPKPSNVPTGTQVVKS